MFFQIQIKSEPLFDEAYDDGVVIDGTYSEADNEVSSFFVTIICFTTIFLQPI